MELRPIQMAAKFAANPHAAAADRCSAVVVAQLVERSLPIREVRGSNPFIGKNLFIY